MNQPEFRHRSLRLAASNIAWDAAADDAAAAVLRRHGATGVEIAPTKWRERPLDATSSDVAAYRRAWANRGLTIVSLQSLLFARPDLQLFGNEVSRAAFIDFIRRTIDLAAALGARALVFGSPSNRRRGDFPLAEATAIATDVFRTLGAHAEASAVALCIEANPVGYGCDFITTTAQAVDFCRAVGHPGVRVNADVGGMMMAGESPRTSIEDAGACLGHVHASEPQLAELGTEGNVEHLNAAAGLTAIGYHGWVSVEMRGNQSEGPVGSVAAVARAVARAAEWYGPALLPV